MGKVRRLGSFLAVAGVCVLGLGACGGGDDEGTPAADRSSATASAAALVTEDRLPSGFEAAPKVTIGGKVRQFDKIPGHYWKVLDDRGFAVGLHFQNGDAKDVAKKQLIYMVYALPGNCGSGSHAKAIKSKNATVLGDAPPPGFDHWHAVVGGGSRVGHWLMHIPVRDFTFAGPKGNPLEGKAVTAGVPQYVPVCDIR